MSLSLNSKSSKKIVIVLIILSVIFGLFARFYLITENQFVYYDEGFFLQHNVDFLYFMEKKPPENLKQVFRYLQICMHIALAEGKALWAFLANLRAFFVGVSGWFFLRVISAVFGSVTLLLVYLFTKKYYQSRAMGLLALVLMCTFPSHVYYSRLGLQEALSTCLFLAGIYFYLFPRKLNYRTFLSGFLFACVFYTNYRMIVIPFLIFSCELFMSFAEKKKPHFQRLIWNILTFTAFVVLVGNVDQGANTEIVFAWIFYQAGLATGDNFDFINMLSYPYYIFKLESVIFGLFFFGNIYYLVKRRWRDALPFFLVMVQMVLFSFAQEKGVRYVCAVMPFMVISVASLVYHLYQEYQHKNVRLVIGLLFTVMIFWHSYKVAYIMGVTTDYDRSINQLVKNKPNVKVMSSQPLIQKMYTPNPSQVIGVPRQLRFVYALYMNGYEYLIIDPQAYISYTKDGLRFKQQFEGYLDFVDNYVNPTAIYPHFNKILLERFVLEHNQNLRRSLQFLRASKTKDFGLMKIYSVREILTKIVQQKSKNPRLFNELEGVKNHGIPRQ